MLAKVSCAGDLLLYYAVTMERNSAPFKHYTRYTFV